MVRTEKDKLIIEVQTPNSGARLQQLLEGLIFVVGKTVECEEDDHRTSQHIAAVTNFMLSLVPDEKQMDEALKVKPYSSQRSA